MAGFRVGIKFKGRKGTVMYDTEKKEFKIEHPDRGIIERVTEYLNAKRKFQIPESDRIDDFRLDIGLPGESEMYAQLALSEMYGETGVLVEWDRANFDT
jgi:hypothetical protein